MVARGGAASLSVATPLILVFSQREKRPVQPAASAVSPPYWLIASARRRVAISLKSTG